MRKIANKTLKRHLLEYRIIQIPCIIVIAIFILNILVQLIACLTQTYPLPMLGIDVYTWYSAFGVELMLALIEFSIPLSFSVIGLIYTIVKIKRLKKLDTRLELENRNNNGRS